MRRTSCREGHISTKYLYIQTFGCQMNVNDSDKIVTLLKGEGYETTEDAAKADLILVNTCSIREKAAQKAFSQLGRFRMLKQRKPDLKLAVAGCLAQQSAKKLLSRAPFVDIVLGTHQIHALPRFIRRAEAEALPVVETAFTPTVKSLDLTAMPKNGGVSAYVTIMQGCDNFCAYCVVPYLRGPERSRPAEDVLAEVRRLTGHGIREVTLLGQNVNAYGKTTDGGGAFGPLLRAIGRVGGIERIRFTTSHPRDLSEDTMRCFAEVDALCGHIHLPVQSGSDAILERMNRGYTSTEYLQKVDRLRHYCPDISITSDVIVGFPGETEKDYEQTLALMERVTFDNLFSFKYSGREGTPAAKLMPQVPETMKAERLKRLQSLQQQHTLKRNRMLEGTVLDVLVEGRSRQSASDMTGRTRSNKIVNFRGGCHLAGRTCRVRIQKAYLHSLRGEMDEGDEPPCLSK